MLETNHLNFIVSVIFQKSLAENVRSFETLKETEKKKLEEERKWVRREKALFEKTVKEKKNNFERRTQDEVEELQNKVRLILNFLCFTFYGFNFVYLSSHCFLLLYLPQLGEFQFDQIIEKSSQAFYIPSLLSFY